ncbi:hypothetical protein FA15DRAFT_245433 [Coprinopsis marcescibilis]|uniref:Cupredoxin n=1 Tax=Coprinopsis marcescibilis TaxID=230819 RepID=A0A5C3L483_COPMA|nr:hypothetical protein FA15DRAFT_245433 [Coprinopsis marcescibilis]
MTLLLLSLSVFLLFRYVYAQTSHTVIVGLEGSFFNPPTLSAGLGDTISFVFAGEIHTVTQSTFEDPCAPLAGGFNSGLAGRARNSSRTPPVWDLKVTDVSSPIWFFCQANRPAFHCSAGMVGVINPPSQDLYAQFVNSAKAVSSSPLASIATVLTGVGAYATAPPAIPAPTTTHLGASSDSTVGASLSASSLNALSAPTAEATAHNPAPASAASSQNLNLIVGVAVGGGLGVFLILALLFLCLRYQRTIAHNRYPSLHNSRSSKDSTQELVVRPNGSKNLKLSPITAEHTSIPHQSSQRSNGNGVFNATPLEPLRRRATTVSADSSSRGTTTGTIGYIAPFTASAIETQYTAASSSNISPFNGFPADPEEGYHDRKSSVNTATNKVFSTSSATESLDSLPLPRPLPLLSSLKSRSTTTLSSSNVVRGGHMSVASIGSTPVQGQRHHRDDSASTVALAVFPAARMTDGYGRQRYLFVSNPAADAGSDVGVAVYESPEQYWSAQMGGGAEAQGTGAGGGAGGAVPDNHAPYSSSPPNYFAATAGGQGAWNR